MSLIKVVVCIICIRIVIDVVVEVTFERFGFGIFERRWAFYFVFQVFLLIVLLKLLSLTRAVAAGWRALRY
jgi:hypothetical protein